MRWALFFFIALLTLPVHAQPVVADLSRDRVEIRTDFDGAEIVIFGATEGEGDVAVVVYGPRHDIEIRRKGRINGLWMTAERAVFEKIPGVYHVASSRPIEELASVNVLKANQIGIDNLLLNTSGRRSQEEKSELRRALVQRLKSRNLYSEEDGGIQFLGGRLFKSKIILPPDIPVGTYRAEIFLFNEGRMITAQSKTFEVEKMGASAQIYNFATEYSFFYGLTAIVLAAAMGTMAGFMFRS